MYLSTVLRQWIDWPIGTVAFTSLRLFRGRVEAADGGAGPENDEAVGPELSVMMRRKC